MSASIPQRIRQKVVEFYFSTPKSMDWIAQKCGITKSSVFNIVHAKMAEDPDFTLMRYLVVNLDKMGTDVPEYATGIRIQHLLGEYGVDTETGESIMEGILSMCYREHWAPSKAVSTLKRFEESAREWGMSPHGYAADRIKAFQLMQSYNVQIDNEREKLKTILMSNESLSRNYKLTVDKKAIDRLNKRLGRNAVGEQQFLEKLEDIRLEPEKFWYLFDEELLHLSSNPGPEQIK